MGFKKSRVSAGISAGLDEGGSEGQHGTPLVLPAEAVGLPSSMCLSRTKRSPFGSAGSCTTVFTFGKFSADLIAHAQIIRQS
jgi:hypothetical protein